MKGFNIGLVEGVDVNRSLAGVVKKSINILSAFKKKVGVLGALMGKVCFFKVTWIIGDI